MNAWGQTQVGAMSFDYNSVLMASGAAGVALGFTLLTSWLRQRSSTFLLTWAVAISIVIVAIVFFSSFQGSGDGGTAMLAGILLTSAYAVEYGGMTQFRENRFRFGQVAALGILGAVPIAVPGLLGLDGLSFLAINVMSGLILGYTGVQFWKIRSESPVPIGAIAVLHYMLAVSYFLCAAVLALETPLYLNGEPPSNWAEVLNLAVSVIAITGIGGLFVTVHQERISRQHQMASLTDALTGLHNRRALFERFSSGVVASGTALIVFDLDDFKGHNDRHGHAFGDLVLERFGQLLREHVRADDMAVRLGGEEFVLVLGASSATRALALAERVRGAMGRIAHDSGGQSVICTVSAGMAVAEKSDTGLDTLIRKADNALYLSKRTGRNRVSHTASSAA